MLHAVRRDDQAAIWPSPTPSSANSRSRKAIASGCDRCARASADTAYSQAIAPIAHHHRAVGQDNRFVHIVGDEEHAGLMPRHQFLDQRLHL